jgi:hypothetical protein
MTNGPQCIDDGVEFGRADNQVDAIAIDIEQQFTTGSARIFGCQAWTEIDDVGRRRNSLVAADRRAAADGQVGMELKKIAVVLGTGSCCSWIDMHAS